VNDLLPTREADGVPRCSGDGMRMAQTIVGWRCPFCGAAVLPVAA
jgi:hypothetical protein